MSTQTSWDTSSLETSNDSWSETELDETPTAFNDKSIQRYLYPWANDCHYQLVIVKGPPVVFMCKQGGSKKCMNVIVRLIPKWAKERSPMYMGTSSNIGMHDGFCELPLTITLVYDNRGFQEVENQDILNLKVTGKSTSMVLKYLSSSNQYVYEAEINFRIEQVSRKHNDRKFRLKISLSKSQEEWKNFQDQFTYIKLADWLESQEACLTEAILVKSKLKSQNGKRQRVSTNDALAPVTSSTRPRLSCSSSSETVKSDATSSPLKQVLDDLLEKVNEVQSGQGKILESIAMMQDQISEISQTLALHNNTRTSSRTFSNSIDMILQTEDLLKGLGAGGKDLSI